MSSLKYKNKTDATINNLQIILQTKSDVDSYEPTPARHVVTKIFEIGNKLEEDQDRYIYFYEISSYVLNNIAIDRDARFIFNTLEGVSRKIFNNIKNGNLKIKDVFEEKEKYKDAHTIGMLKHLLNTLELKYYSREELEEIEKMLVNNSKEEYKNFPNKAARGKVMGSLNEGFFTKNFTDLDQYLRDNGSISYKNKRFVPIMPDDMLKYRLAMLEMARLYASKAKKEKITLEEMREKNKHLGELTRSIYIEKKYVAPEETLLECVKEKGKSRTRSRKMPEQIEMKL